MRNNKARNGKPRTGDKGTKDNAFFHSREVKSSKPEVSSDEYNHQGDKKSFNDPEWYVNSEQILKDSARIPYSIPVGTCYRRDGFLSSADVATFTESSYNNAVPGIMVSYLMPTLGATDQSASAGINIAANSLFQYVRSKISGSRKYEAVDMMIYLGAMDSIFTNITWLTRAYATAYTYHQANKYLSRALLEAQGIDYDDFIDHLPNFRTALNIEIAKIRSMYLPSVLPIFKRHSWMFSHYFIEGDSEKDQIYMHSPAGFYLFDLDSAGKGMLHAKPFINDAHSQKWKWNELVDIIRMQIGQIFRREDFNTISGDMLKAYEGRVFSITEIPDIATVSLTNSIEVLLQFKNAKYKCISASLGEGSESFLANFFDYVQNTNSDLVMIGCTALYGTLPIQQFLRIQSNDNVMEDLSTSAKIDFAKCVANEWGKETLLTTPSHDVQPIENMINTRLTLGIDYAIDASAPNGLRYDRSYFGSEWPVCYRLYAYHQNKSNGNITLFSRTYDRAMLIDSGNAAIWVTSQEPIRSAFRFLPELSLVMYSNPSNTISDSGRSIFEVDNYALVTNSTLEGLHNAAILGEYNIPDLSIGR